MRKIRLQDLTICSMVILNENINFLGYCSRRMGYAKRRG
jgi:hypothetical protein